MPHQRLLIGHLLYKVLSFRCISLRSICSGRSLFLIGEDKYVGQSLLDGSDASGVAAFDDVFDLFGKYQFLLLYNLTVFDDVDGDVVVDECQYIQIQHIDVTFYFQNILLPIFPLRAFLMIATVQSNLSS